MFENIKITIDVSQALSKIEQGLKIQEQFSNDIVLCCRELKKHDILYCEVGKVKEINKLKKIIEN